MYKLTQATATTTHAPKRVPRVPPPRLDSSAHSAPSASATSSAPTPSYFFFAYAKTPQNFSQGGISKLGFVWWAS